MIIQLVFFLKFDQTTCILIRRGQIYQESIVQHDRTTRYGWYEVCWIYSDFGLVYALGVDMYFYIRIHKLLKKKY